MKIAYTMASGRGDTDLLLFKVAQSLLKQGRNPVGTVQINTEREYDGPCDMDVKVLPSGPTIRISQNLGRESRGCRLNPEALETAVTLVTSELSEGADCLIINKFGKHEAEGRGFRSVIAEALALEIPVLVGLNALNLEAFHTFCDYLAVELPPNAFVIENWLFSNAVKENTAA